MSVAKSSQICDDETVLTPSPQRVRNILTLEERVRAIQAYDKRPMYTKVAKMFNCSWEQIKSIIVNRDAIMEFYSATRNTRKDLDPNQDEIRKRKLAYLGECMYEYIQRAQYHLQADLNEELIRNKALEFRDLIEINNFVPNKPWINHFKATYCISLSNRQIMLTRRPPASLDLKDIMIYCGKNLSIPVSEPVPPLYRARTRAELLSANQATFEEVQNRRKRKINFLERNLYEYIQRATFHHKSPLDFDKLRDVAIALRDLLKIDNFFPDRVWFKHFKNRFNFNIAHGIAVTDRTPPLSLDLRDILSFCSRNGKEQPPATVTLAPKEDPLPRLYAKTTTNLKTVMPRQQQQQLRVQTKLDVDDDDDDVVAVEIKPELIEIKDDDEVESNECQPPPLKIKRIETLNQPRSVAEKTPPSPGHWSEHSDDGETEPELPKHVRNYADALRLLKPLEEFAMLEENYRVIGLITQLEEIFKNPPKKTHAQDDNEEDDADEYV